MHVIDISSNQYGYATVYLDFAKEAGIVGSKYVLMTQQTSIFNEGNFREVAEAMAAGFGKKAHIVVKPGTELIKYNMAAGVSIGRNWWFAYFV